MAKNIERGEEEKISSTRHRSGQGTESDPVIVGKFHNPNAKKMRIVHISDTHMKHGNYLLDIPHGDVLIHSGDFAVSRKSKKLTEREAFENDVRSLNSFFSKLPHQHKIFVAGNHETSFNPYRLFSCQIQSYLKGVVYLQDSSVNIDGVVFYGSPWTASVKMGFSSQNLKQYWKKIPQETNILITHMPPLNILDLAHSKKMLAKTQALSEEERRNLPTRCKVCKKPLHLDRKHWGCPELRRVVLHGVRPEIHLFGHVHNQNGLESHDGILFSNAAMDLCPRANVIDYYYAPSDDSPSAETAPNKVKTTTTFLQTYPLDYGGMTDN